MAAWEAAHNLEGSVVSKAPNPTFLRVADVAARLGLSKASVYRLMKTDGFPKPLQLTKTAVAWRVSEVAAWENARPRAAGSTERMTRVVRSRLDRESAPAPA